MKRDVILGAVMVLSLLGYQAYGEGVPAPGERSPTPTFREGPGNVRSVMPNAPREMGTRNRNEGMEQERVNPNANANARPNIGMHANPQPSASVMGDNRPDPWRYRFENGRWWYWTPQNRWMIYNNGQWADYVPAPSYAVGYGSYEVAPGTTSYYPSYEYVAPGSVYYYPSYGYTVGYPAYWYGPRVGWGWYGGRRWWW